MCQGGGDAPAVAAEGAPAAGPAAALGQPVTEAPRQRFPIFRNSPRAVILRPESSERGDSPVSLLRPVPAGPAGAREASVWSPVQRVSGEVPVTSTPGGAQDPVAVLEKPQVTAAAPSGTPAERLLPEPTVLPGAAGRLKGVGPPPPPDKRATGYPDLAAPLITQPVDAPREGSKRALSAYIIEPPDLLRISGPAAISDTNQPFSGDNLVRPDGTIGFGPYPSIFVAGMTIDQAKIQVARAIAARLTTLSVDTILKDLRVDVVAFNSKFVYVITDGGGYGEQVIRLPYTGNETVLDAIAQIQGLPAVASKSRIWVARATPGGHGPPNILPVDWCGITQRGEAATNYQLYPSDRIYVNSDPRIRLDSRLAKFLAPIERLFGITLLASSTVNSIRTGTNAGAGAGAVR
jgi:polysaccharide export outer membrane protein